MQYIMAKLAILCQIMAQACYFDFAIACDKHL
jgi:hypothetical protein